MEPSRSRKPAVTAVFHDRPLSAGEEPAPGMRVLSPRMGYLHHGIYVGAGRVVHYEGRAWGLFGGRVEEVSLARFGRGRGVWVRPTPRSSAFTTREIVRRARARVGEARYRILANNCEHFCEWCVHGSPRSYQVEQLLKSFRPLLAIAKLVVARAGSQLEVGAP